MKNFPILFFSWLFTAILIYGQEKPLKLLALGDSYTVATSESFNNGWPFQLIAYLEKKDLEFEAPKVIAGAGWTTSKLLEEIEKEKTDNYHDLVFLMIGVNNQYRGLPKEEFQKDFSELLEKSIVYANGKASRTYVVSIPDWGVTPFAKFKNSKKIAREIDEFNTLMQKSSTKMGVHYIDVTKSSKNMAVQPSLIASDSLHPSKRMYKIWAKKMAKIVTKNYKP